MGRLPYFPVNLARIKQKRPTGLGSVERFPLERMTYLRIVIPLYIIGGA